MMYTNYLKRKYAGSFKALVLFITGAFILSLNSCITYSIYKENMTPQQFEKLENPEKEWISELVTKDTIIKAIDNPIIFVPGKSLFIVEKTDSLITLSTNPLIVKKIKSSREIKMADILSIKTMYSKINTGKTILATLIYFVAIAGLIYSIWKK